MKSRGEITRLAAAKLVITVITVLVGISIVVGLVYVLVKMMTILDYQPRALHQTMLSIGMVVAGLLALRWIRTSLQQGMVFYVLFSMAMVVAMEVLDYRLYVGSYGRDYNVFPTLYVPHLGILMVALIVGLRSALVTAVGGVAYLMFMNRYLAQPGAIGTPLIIALALPFTAILVERLLDEVEKEAYRARLAELSLDVMAHDLGNPLAVLSATLEMLEEEGPPSEYRETLMRAVRRNTRTLQRLLDEFREIPHLDKAVPLEMVDLRGIVSDIVELYARPMSKKGGQTLNSSLQPAEVLGVASRLSRLARELLTNAIKYTPRGGRIEVTLRIDEEAILRVSDNGWGIGEEELVHVFDPHWRGSVASQVHVSGTGLGLYICRNIVENHGGSIKVDSQKGKGTTFVVCLPLPEMAVTSSSLDDNVDQEESESQPDIFPLGEHPKKFNA